MDRDSKSRALCWRTFLAATSTALMGVAWGGLVPQTVAATRHSQRGGTPHYAASGDVCGLDAHTHNQLHVSAPTSVIYTGLTDIEAQGNIIPGLAESWEPTKGLTARAFHLRQGVLFHNGREVDAETVQLNLKRIKAVLPIVGKIKREATVRLTARRKALYTEAWNIVNVELPLFYLQELTQTSAAAKTLRGYQPGSEGALPIPRRGPARRL